jgi:hypothetical protein
MLPAVLAGIGLLVLPGLAFLALLPREERAALRLDEVVFLVPATGTMAAAWVGLVLAEAGRFSLVTAGLILGVSGLVVVAIRLRRLFGMARPRLRDWVPFTLLLALALGLDARPSEYVVGGRDPGIYVASMALIGRTGGIIYTDPTVLSIPQEDVELFYRNPGNPDFSGSRFMGFPLENPRTGRVFAEFFHLFPAFGAFLFQTMGIKGALATPVVFGVLGTLAVFLAIRRILGPVPAMLGAALLALNVIQVWFARFPMSEPMSQFLLFTGFLALVHWEERRATALGFLAGTAFGLSLLVRIDSALILVPIGLYVGIRRMRRDLSWREALPVLAPFAALCGHAVLHALVWSSKYTLEILNRPYWKQPPIVWVLAAIAVLVVVYAADRLGPRLNRWMEHRARGLGLAFVVGLFVVAGYAYFIRPALSAWAGGDNNDTAAALAHPQILHALGFRRLAAQDAQAFVRFGWVVEPLGLALALAGLARLVWRPRPRALLLVLTTLVFSAFYFYKLRVWNDYFFAARRFVPVLLPAALGFAGFALAELGKGRRWRRAVAVTLGLALAALFARATLRIVRHVDWRGSVAFVEEVGRFLGPRDIVIFEQKESIHLLSLPLWAVNGVPILELARWNPDPARLDHALRTWRAQYDNVYLAYTYRAEKGLCGVFLQRVRDFDFRTVEWERNYVRMPTTTEPRGLRFTIARMVLPEEVDVPALPELDVGGSDDLQVSGFFVKEGGQDHTYRWTGPCATLLLPALAKAQAVVIVASIGSRPESPPAAVSLQIGGETLGSFVATPDWRVYRFSIPTRLSGHHLLRLNAPTWRPKNVDPTSNDERDLGIMVDRVWTEALGTQPDGKPR